MIKNEKVRSVYRATTSKKVREFYFFFTFIIKRYSNLLNNYCPGVHDMIHDIDIDLMRYL